MAAPLYQGLNMPQKCQGHYGLWFERFFNQYSPHNWEFADNTQKSKWLQEFHHQTVGHKEALANHAQAQTLLSQTLAGKALTFKAQGHFVTGMGNPHPVENGFAWHPTLGVPYLTGAAVKGLVRAYIDNHLDVPLADKKKLLLAWFGSTSKDPTDKDYEAQAGALIFFDAIPTEPVRLGVDVMTPHMGDWYAKGAKEPNQAATVPADWHDPVPITFLVAHKITLLFSFALRQTAPEAKSIQLSDVAYVLEQALQYAGAGGKTATGYGGFIEDLQTLKALEEGLANQANEQKAAAEKLAQAAQKQAHLESLSPLEREIEELGIEIRLWINALENKRWEGDDLKKAAIIIKQRMQAQNVWAETSAAKNKDKDKKYQNTLKVMRFL